MPTFFEAADRLRRTVWNNVEELANEVWTVFKTGRIDTSRPATFTNDDEPTAPPITTKQRPADEWPAINITRGPNEVNITLGDDGSLTFSDENGDPVTINGVDGLNGGDGQDGEDGQTGTVSSATSAVCGVVAGRSSGAVYSVRCYLGPPTGVSIGTVLMTAANLDPGDEIPVGFEVQAVGFFDSNGVLTGGRFYPPVFVTEV